MAFRYQSQAASGYNAAAPPDDGSQIETNRGKWATIKTKIGDPLKSYIDAINAQLVAAFDLSSGSVAGPYNTVAADNGRVLDATGTLTISLMDGSSAGAGYTTTIKNIGTGVVTIGLVTNTNKLEQVVNGTVTLTPGQSRTYRLGSDGITYELIGGSNLGVMIGAVMDYAGSVSTLPGGYLNCSGGAVSRTTYAQLFAVIGTTWGIGDGSTTFNVPPPARVSVDAGQPSVVETQASVSASGNQLPVATNTAKWITGMQVVTSATTGFGGAFTNATYFLRRIDSTHVAFHNTLAQAQAGTGTVTVTGSGSFTMTWTGTSRALGEIGGEEAHAMSSTELLSHNHVLQSGVNAAAATSAPLKQSPSPSVTPDDFNTGATGGNAAMNIMQPYAVFNRIIRAL